MCVVLRCVALLLNVTLFLYQILGRPEDPDKVDWTIEDSLSNWWRPNFEAPQVRENSKKLHSIVCLICIKSKIQ